MAYHSLGALSRFRCTSASISKECSYDDDEY